MTHNKVCDNCSTGSFMSYFRQKRNFVRRYFEPLCFDGSLLETNEKEISRLNFFTLEAFSLHRNGQLDLKISVILYECIYLSFICTISVYIAYIYSYIPVTLSIMVCKSYIFERCCCEKHKYCLLKSSILGVWGCILGFLYWF